MGEDGNLVAELLLIIGGFILAETIVRWFLSLSEGLLSFWILPALAVLLIITALGIKKYGILNYGTGLTSAAFISLSVILVVLMKSDNISSICFLWAILGLSILTIITQLIIFFSYKRK